MDRSRMIIIGVFYYIVDGVSYQFVKIYIVVSILLKLKQLCLQYCIFFIYVDILIYWFYFKIYVFEIGILYVYVQFSLQIFVFVNYLFLEFVQC